jgi:glutamate-1-semialdehyde 2,1-aminomutase
MPTAPETSQEIFERNRQVIPGGVVSLNRAIDPVRAFVKAQGAYLWDAEGRRYIDYHAAFSPYLLGHAHSEVDAAVIASIQRGESLMGAGPTPWEGELARLLIECVPTLESVQITNTGSEATFNALRIARAATERDGVVIMQGGYNGWHNDVTFNLADPLARLAADPEHGELPLRPMTAGIPRSVFGDVHPVPYNDLAAVESVFEKGTIAAILLEPILQNIGVVKPRPGYLAGLRELCDRHDVVLIFDEVKTGFRHALGGYQSLCGVCPDLSTFGKAVANGYPLGVIGGKKKYMDHFVHPDPAQRVMIAGTYNAHPIPVAAAIATLKHLRNHRDEIYPRLDRLGQRMESGLEKIFRDRGIPTTIARQGSAFVVYFMDHAPVDWRDIAAHHDGKLDLRYRRALIERGIFHFPASTKQGSLSAAHTESDVDETLAITADVVQNL